MSYEVKDKNDFEKKSKEIEDDALVVLEFYATWCGSCKKIMPKVEALTEEFPSIHVFKVDIEICEELTTEYKIQSLPSFVFIKKSETLETFVGSDIEQVKKLIRKYNTKAPKATDSKATDSKATDSKATDSKATDSKAPKANKKAK